MKKFTIFITFFLFYIVFCLVLNPNEYMAVCLDGLRAWALNVLPGVLPFIFLTKAISSLGHAQTFANTFSRPFQKMYGCSGSSSYVYLMSILSGYPVGAKMTADLYQNGEISRTEALRMTSFCSNSGPMFIIGAVGAGMLKSAYLGYIIFFAHALGALLNGFLYRKLKRENLPNAVKSKQEKRQFNIGEIVNDSAISIIAVGTIIAIFFVVIHSLQPFFNLFPSPIASVLEGLIEITKGCIDISSVMPLKLATIACTFVISFGGLSTILQSLTMLKKLDMPVGLFILQKITHALIATILIAFFLLFI